MSPAHSGLLGREGRLSQGSMGVDWRALSSKTTIVVREDLLPGDPSLPLQS